MGAPGSLTPGQLELLRAELERSLTKLMRSMEATDRAARPVTLDQTTVGRLSRMDALQNQSLTQGLQERERVNAVQLTAALQRLDDGEYGFCEGCGDPIGFERLSVFPETRTCSRCAA